MPAKNAIRVPENLPQNYSYRTSKSYQSAPMKTQPKCISKTVQSYCPFFLEFKSISINSARDL